MKLRRPISKFFGFKRGKTTVYEEPIRSEIFSASRLENHAESLARAQKIEAAPRTHNDLPGRMAENRKVLEQVYIRMLRAIQEKRAITPAAEWLIDNFHIVRALMRDIHDHLPPRYYRELPKLAEGPLRGFPRVYGIAWAFVAHTDSRFEPDLLERFLHSYQKIQPLSIGELWAVSITLRVVLIENLRRLAERIAGSQEAREEADEIANEILGLGQMAARPISAVIASLEHKPLPGAFTVQLLQRLRFQGSRFDPLLEWLESRLARDGLVPDELVSSEHSAQTNANATVRNIITSARLMTVFDWQGFFEEVSLVENALRTHTQYGEMDFATRNRYRQAIEELAKNCDYTELELTNSVLEKCRKASQAKERGAAIDDRSTDPGFYLISAGRFLIEPESHFRPPLSLMLRRWYLHNATFIYLFGIAITTLLFWLPLVLFNYPGSASLAFSVLAIATLFPASQIGVALLNRTSIALLGPRYLPRLRLEYGIPKELRTFVVVPTLFLDEARIEEQLEQLEIYYLANPKGELYFALLSDWRDSPTENADGDETLLQIALKRLDRLNEKYGRSPDGYQRFYVFHRRRIYNPGEQKWIGWERKRGKLHEFNRLLRGHTDHSFLTLNNQLPIPPTGVRYVITLDADTRLPNGSVCQLVGSMAHPLNRAKFDQHLGRVVSGYGILQPRVTPTLPTAKESTIFQRLSTGPSGIDPYASAISDIYQDLFGEGSFTGKGIYDLDVFEQALAGKISENSVLSHDLLEGNFARCGFISDVEVFEEFPWHSGVASARTHRWIRGDWQLLPWIFGRAGNAISVIGRWKMIDNLRRSLITPFTFLVIALAIIVPPPHPEAWILLAILSLGCDSFVSAIAGFLLDRRGNSLWQHILTATRDFYFAIERTALAFLLLASQAWSNLDAISRAIFRLFISHRHLLEWTTAAQVSRSAGLRPADFFWNMQGGLFLSIAMLIGTIYSPYSLGTTALFFPIFWLLSPALTKIVSTPSQRKILRPLAPEDLTYLHMNGRRIWRFFSTFVTAEDNHLPPDNFQEDPHPVVAHRSSPTNFGLYLLSTLAARDFGWIGLCETADRLEKTITSMNDLPRYEGHFYNWYETRERRALEPRYISSVDNGNLAGHLLAVAQGCEEYLREYTPKFSFNQGFIAGFLLMQDSSAFLLKKSEPLTKQEERLLGAIDEFSEVLLQAPGGQNISIHHWIKLCSSVDQVVHTAVACRSEEGSDERHSELWEWSKSIQADIHSHYRDLSTLAPWAEFYDRTLTENTSKQSQEQWEKIRQLILQEVPFAKLIAHAELLLEEITELRRQFSLENELVPDFLAELTVATESSIRNTRSTGDQLKKIVILCHSLFHQMDFGLLYDPVRKLFSIGFRVGDASLDPSFYDLMASEARLTSFVAIAKGDVPAAHWFSLGRGLTVVDRRAALISWSGSMFEYLMPSLVMHTPEGSLMDQTSRLIVKRQIQYGQERGVPWGISESAYNKRDLHLTYQYTNFGVPDLGLKRGLGIDLVIAPYATLLATMIDPASAVENLRRISRQGGLGPFGFYEAIDFTPSRLPEGQKSAVVKAYMAHHQGMSLVSIANILNRQGMRHRFHAEPIVQAASLLLQERSPRHVVSVNPNEESFQIGFVREEAEHVVRKYHTVNRPVPTTQLLSNGEYTVMLTSSGSGFSRCRDLAVTRWREDVTRDNWGTYIYLSEVDTGKTWSAGYQPTGVKADRYEVTFAEDRATFSREDNDIACDMEIFVSPEENAEIRRISVHNKGTNTRIVELTSYAEVALAPQLADAAHPAFSNLFVQTEFIPSLNTILATRRARSTKEKPSWLAHVVSVDRYAIGDTQWDSDRALFIGRNRSPKNPLAMDPGRNLSNSMGPVLDPVFSLRKKLRLPPGGTARITFSTIVAANRTEILDLAENYRDDAKFDRAANLAWTQAQVRLHFLGIEPDEAHLFQRLGTRLLFSDSSLRPSSEIIKRCTKDITGLWAQGISGDHPIILLRVDDVEDRGIVRQLLKAQEYFASKRFTVDLIILNDKANSYAQEVQAALESMAHSGVVAAHTSLGHAKGSTFVIRADLLSQEDRILLYATARAVISSRQGSLAEQARRVRIVAPKALLPRLNPPISSEPKTMIDETSLSFFQGLGGFTPDGKEYVVILKPGEHTPAPWINVISNGNFGFQVSESGSGYTWASNSRENQITPWLNDPVSDPSGEAFYFLDKDSGALWSPTANPIRQPNTTYLARHGQGYSRFEQISHGIRSELTQFVALDSPVKISRIVLENRSRQTRRISVAGYVEWVLGFSRATMAPTTITEIDEASGAIFATNSRSNEFGSKVSFFATTKKPSSFTGDRTEFLGRNNGPDTPAGIFSEKGLSGKVGAALDPCGALQCELEIPPGRSVELSFFLGQEENRTAASETVLRLRDENLDRAFAKVSTFWENTLTAVQVKTPDMGMNLLLNRWLLYQTTACRLWARAAFYQAGGAFGFRDQLQDVMALLYSQPKMARQHLLRAAARQFIEGDVQHWWHPPSGRGVRTHFSDDLIWLPFTVFQYVSVTGDQAILDAEITFLEGPHLRPEQEDSYFTPTVSHNAASLFEHCARTLDRSLATGAHGLPLMGAGDWNDGMNRVGHEGKGESVWLAWFLITNLRQFADFAESRGEIDRASTWRDHAERLLVAIEEKSWDGEWYRRAYFDDGTPLGSAAGAECQIDSLAQTWAVISKAGNPARSRTAMAAVERILVREQDQMILLFTPAFDKTDLDPGYIKGYLPGVRENGGQYTHAAVWCVVAQAMLGNGRRAFELFSLLNPMNHALSRSEVERYKVEPYVLAADVYSEPPHRGRGGWTWYTGSCGWMYRAGVESILGLDVKAGILRLKPCIPPEWPEFELSYRYGGSKYEILLKNPHGISSGKVIFQLDSGPEIEAIELRDDGRLHRVSAILMNCPP